MQPPNTDARHSQDDVVQHDQPQQDLNAATNGAGKGKKGGNGYGECWHCGEWGHPRRECPHLNDPSKGKDSLGALKGGNGKGVLEQARFTSIGLLKLINYGGWQFLEWWFLRFLCWNLTERWQTLQGGLLPPSDIPATCRGLPTPNSPDSKKIF